MLYAKANSKQKEDLFLLQTDHREGGWAALLKKLNWEQIQHSLLIFLRNRRQSSCFEDLQRIITGHRSRRMGGRERDEYGERNNRFHLPSPHLTYILISVYIVLWLT